MRRELRSVALATACIAAAAPAVAARLNLTAVPSQAAIYHLNAAGGKTRLGVGSGQYKTRKDDPGHILVEAEGYRPQSWEFPGSRRYTEREVTLELTTRVIELVTSPADATILIGGEAIGEGVGELAVDKGMEVVVEVRRVGFAEVRRSYQWDSAATDLPLHDSVDLTTRVVELGSNPTGAALSTGSESIGETPQTIAVPDDTCVELELTLAGYRSEGKSLCNREGEPVPPTAVEIVLSREVLVTAAPAGAVLRVEGVEMTGDPVAVSVTRGACVVVEASKEGFLPVEQAFCDREDRSPPPTEARLELGERVVEVRSIPPGSVEIDGTALGADTSRFYLPLGGCRTVRVIADGHLPREQSVCYEEEGVYPPTLLEWELERDEAFSASFEAAERVNRELPMTFGTEISFEQAWREMGLVVLRSFDVVEVSDAALGYLRTGWQVERFGNSTIRTRVIVKQASVAPIRLTLKLVSERAAGGDIPLDQDQSFEPWSRALLAYQELLDGLSPVRQPGGEIPEG